MKYLPYIIIATIALILAFCGGWYGGSHSVSHNDTITVRDTVVDTLTYRQPIPVDSIVLKYKTVKLPVADTIYAQGSEIIKVDSVFVEVPIHQKEYQDSTYHAWVSGFNVNLDSINVYQKTIHITERIREPSKRWGLGIQLGAGYNMDKRVYPYIGIGVSYNILTW